MSKLKVGVSPLTNRIYAGNVLKNGTWGANKQDISEEAVRAVAEHLLRANEKLVFNADINGMGAFKNAKKYELKVVAINE